MAKPGRQGVSEEDIRQAIEELLAEDQPITPTRVRELLGTGSFTTISREIANWRLQQRKTPKPKFPPVPKVVSSTLESVWEQAWLAANETFENDRVRFRDSAKAAASERDELLAEVGRLETETESLVAELAEFAENHTQMESKLSEQSLAVERARGQIEALRAEVQNAAQEKQHATSQLAHWIERATASESRLADLQRARDEESLAVQPTAA